MPTPTSRSIRGPFAPWTLASLLSLSLMAVARAAEPAGSRPSKGAGAKADPGAGPAATYNRDVAPILHAKCLACHRRDQVGPFPLETFEQARKRGHDIAAVVEERRMPPWKPVAGFGPKLAHDRSLVPAEVDAIERWVRAGMPEGAESDRPAPPTFAEGWTLGQPDLVLEMPEPFAVPGVGADVYRCFVIPTDLPRDVYVSAIEYRPGNARVVHHVMAFVETAGQARSRDAAEAGPGYTSYSGPGVDIVGDLGGWAAGNDPQHLPEGVGRTLPRGADVILQVHYHPSGRPETDRTRIGLHLSRRPVRQTLHWVGVQSKDIHLPPDRGRIRVGARWTMPVDVDVLSIAPHMHQLGREMQVTATHPGGKSQDLIKVGDWDPAWQGTYSFERPVRLVRGTVVEVTAHFDNTAHARNPHSPPRLVRYGHEVSDEMCVAYLGVTKVGQDLTRPGQKDDLFAILVNHARRVEARDLLASPRRR